jgi:hypothetical protein
LRNYYQKKKKQNKTKKQKNKKTKKQKNKKQKQKKKEKKESSYWHFLSANKLVLNAKKTHLGIYY